MVPPRGAIASVDIAVSLTQAARDMFFNRLGRDTEAVRNLLVGTLVKYPQRECRTALRRQPVDGLLYEPIPFISEHFGLQRLVLSFDARIAEMPQCASLHDPPMTVFVRSKIARRRKKKRSERRHRIALPIGTKKRFLHDFFRRFTRPDEALNVAVQRLAALSEELGENLGAGLRGCRHCRVISVGSTLRLSGAIRQLSQLEWGFWSSQVSYASRIIRSVARMHVGHLSPTMHCVYRDSAP